MYINADGFICETCVGTRIDIVIGDVRPGVHISQLVVISTKTSGKDRWKEDSWTFVHPPKKYVLAVINDEYPPPKTFKESSSRLILSMYPKTKDLREFKVTCQTLLEHIL